MSLLLDFNDVLYKAGVDPSGVLVMRHRPHERTLRRAFQWLAGERTDLFDAFQSTHGPQVERMLSKACKLASFIGYTPGRAVFIGLYDVQGSRPLTHEEYWAMPAHLELKSLGMQGFRGERSHILQFDLVQRGELADCKGRLVCEWNAERSWARWAQRNSFPVHALHEESLLVKRPPKAEDLVLSWAELKTLPASWRVAMAQWRGIYFIFDRRRNLGYVGSASGTDNLLGRWLGYAASGHGGNKWLRSSLPDDLQFSVLELVAPSMPKEDVISLETAWKQRLCTKHPHGLNDN